MPRRLRIAVSVLFATLTIAVTGLWARSYWRADSVNHRSQLNAADECNYIGWWSWQGRMRFFSSIERQVFPMPPGWRFSSRAEHSPNSSKLDTRGEFRWIHTDDQFLIELPYWAATCLAAILAGAPWLPASRRFSLRTLFITTTLVALLLGLGGWLAYA